MTFRKGPNIIVKSHDVGESEDKHTNVEVSIPTQSMGTRKEREEFFLPLIPGILVWCFFVLADGLGTNPHFDLPIGQGLRLAA